MKREDTPAFAIHGQCPRCNTIHKLPAGSAMSLAALLMEHLEKYKRLDGFNSELLSPGVSTEGLFGDARGKMFGVLQGTDSSGRDIALYAFSGQFDGRWVLPGWAPPLFNVGDWHKMNDPAEEEIKQLGEMMETHPPDSAIRRRLKEQRKRKSQALMKQLHTLYTLYNYAGESRRLDSFFQNSKGIPTGTGDCCAPKLLNSARLLGVTPKSICEFYWGKANRSGSRSHGSFYPACRDKCQPILGFMLCGISI